MSVVSFPHSLFLLIDEAMIGFAFWCLPTIHTAFPFTQSSVDIEGTEAVGDVTR